MANLNEQRFMILTALSAGRRHGYGLVEDIVELTDGALRPRAGALYHALEGLSKAGLVVAAGEEVIDGRLRRYYEITNDGKKTLGVEAQRRASTAKTAIARLAGELGRRSTTVDLGPRLGRRLV